MGVEGRVSLGAYMFFMVFILDIPLIYDVFL